MIIVNSSNLNAIDYNIESQTLTIEFHNGRTYIYYNVPQQVFEELRNAPSKGKYHHQYIKNNYQYKRII